MSYIIYMYRCMAANRVQILLLRQRVFLLLYVSPAPVTKNPGVAYTRTKHRIPANFNTCLDNVDFACAFPQSSIHHAKPYLWTASINIGSSPNSTDSMVDFRLSTFLNDIECSIAKYLSILIAAIVIFYIERRKNLPLYPLYLDDGIILIWQRRILFYKQLCRYELLKSCSLLFRITLIDSNIKVDSDEVHKQKKSTLLDIYHFKKNLRIIYMVLDLRIGYSREYYLSAFLVKISKKSVKITKI
ncbi:hypothetical protein AGLY_007511 [Aphis glycines]|uniref:Uncharacterized protein n=1 Tax=Aphis glycines TaxID=307491 RepID=A0A6G0TPH4_APHGL|nr:hypothetical protein AGLY_007511 [Aphis glycines]